MDEDFIEVGPLPSWEPWKVSVMIRKMPDGIAAIGLLIAPDENYEGGGITSQRITTNRLRTFPIGLAVQQARYESAKDRPEAAEAQAEIERLTQIAKLNEEIEASKEDERRHQALADYAWEQYAKDLDPRRALLEKAAMLYEIAFEDPETTSPRAYVAERLGKKPATIDVYLREARKAGILAPYEGPQGKHGKPAAKKQSKPTPKKRGKK